MTESAAPRPWLSVVMPLHEGARWIEATLDSLVGEADGVEIIAIDSSNNPETSEMARGYADRLRLTLIHRPEMLGWHDKMNHAVAMASAPHICMLHQDDVWLAGRSAALRRWIAAAPDAALHLAPTAIIDSRGRRLGDWRCPLPRGALPSDLLLERLMVQNFVSVPSPIFTKAAWTSCGGMDTELWYTCDWDLWLKLAGEGDVFHHDEVTTGFRVHGGSLTMTGSRRVEDFESQMQIVLDRHVGRLGARARHVVPTARASIGINVALAAASAGSPAALGAALARLVRLGPRGLRRYFRDSRIVERVVPRLRARFAGAF